MAIETREVQTDLLILGGGMAACGAAVEAKYWGKDLKVTLVDKAAMERSGAVAQGLSAINTYVGANEGENTLEDFVRYVRNDLCGIVREDLVYDVARHVDSTVHLFEKWGLPVWRDEKGRYVREGRWQIMISGESYKCIVAEAAKNALGMENIYERVFVTHLLSDEKDPNQVAGAVGFSVRDDAFYVFKARAVIIACGGAVHVFRPRSTGEGLGRTWYPPWNAGSTYAMQIQAGAEMVSMENRFIPMRFKDGYGPVGAWYLLFGAKTLNAYGEDYTVTRKAELAKFDPYASAKPMPTCLRNHATLLDIIDGKGPIYMDTPTALKKLAAGGDKKKMKELESEAWEDFLDMTISQSLLWAGMNIRPEKTPSEVYPTEPYFMGSHAGCAGAWASGPEDVAPPEYQWGYNRMLTVEGLFSAGDGVGACAHKFSSGSFTEGRIAAKAAVRYIFDHATPPAVHSAKVEELKREIYRPFETFDKHKGWTTDPDINPNYIRPKMFMIRLQKIMDEYAGGISTWYKTSEPMLKRGAELLQILREDSDKLAAENLHELLRCWENVHRMWVADCHVRHVMHRKETRWPGYYYRADFPDMDPEKWGKVFVNSRYDAQTGEWKVFTRPVIQIIPD